jgi:hypothetical protein
MISANELRLGNWVLRHGKPSQIDIGDFRYEEYENHNPIPLTPELMEQTGFKQQGDYLWYEKENVALEETIDGYQLAEYSIAVGIKYVHQLQNLIFTLTGTELEVNLKETTNGRVSTNL